MHTHIHTNPFRARTKRRALALLGERSVRIRVCASRCCLRACSSSLPANVRTQTHTQAAQTYYDSVDVDSAASEPEFCAAAAAPSPDDDDGGVGSARHGLAWLGGAGWLAMSTNVECVRVGGDGDVGDVGAGVLRVEHRAEAVVSYATGPTRTVAPIRCECLRTSTPNVCAATTTTTTM